MTNQKGATVNPAQLARIKPKLTTAHLKRNCLIPSQLAEGVSRCVVSDFAIIAGHGSATQAKSFLAIGFTATINNEEWNWFTSRSLPIPFAELVASNTTRPQRNGYFFSHDLRLPEPHQDRIRAVGFQMMLELASAIESLYRLVGAVELHHYASTWIRCRTQRPVVFTWAPSDIRPHFFNATHIALEKYVCALRSKFAGTITVATDASRRHGSKLCSIAYASDTGDFQALVASPTEIAELETNAIRFALKQYEKVPCQQLRILTDSKIARSRILQEIRVSAELSAHIEIVWVRGHAGHPLNEAAHRLAVSFRRAAEAETQSNFPAIAANIMQESMTDWTALVA